MGGFPTSSSQEEALGVGPIPQAGLDRALASIIKGEQLTD
jgi:hypothetical protein